METHVQHFQEVSLTYPPVIKSFRRFFIFCEAISEHFFDFDSNFRVEEENHNQIDELCDSGDVEDGGKEEHGREGVFSFAVEEEAKFGN